MRKRTGSLLLVAALLAVSCGGSDQSTSDSPVDAEPTAAPDPTAVPTAVPDPTVQPTVEPTAVPEPTVQPTVEPTAVPEPAPFEALDTFAESFVADAGLQGAGIIVVDRDDGVVHHAAYGDFSTDRISMIASSSKMISAGVLMYLDDQGVLDVDAPLTDAVGWAADHPDMTPAQLVSNSSGLVGLGPDILYAPYICQWVPTVEIQSCAETVLTTEGDDDAIVAPDSEFRYGGAQWQVAGGVAEVVSGQSWDDLLTEVYREPCGLDTLGYLSLGQVNAAVGYPVDFGGDPSLHDATANPNIEGGAYISTGDYGTLLLMHLRGGACDGGQVFTQDALDAMHGDRIAAAYDGTAWAGTGYGMGWWIDRDTGIISDGGAWGARAWLNLDAGYGAYWIIEDDSATTQEIVPELEALVHREMTGEEL